MPRSNQTMTETASCVWAAMTSQIILFLGLLFCDVFWCIQVSWFCNYSMTTLKLLCAPTPQTVSVLEERLTLTEDKLKQCLFHQSQVLRDVRASRQRRRTVSQDTDESPVHFTWSQDAGFSQGYVSSPAQLIHFRSCACSARCQLLLLLTSERVFLLLYNFFNCQHFVCCFVILKVCCSC